MKYILLFFLGLIANLSFTPYDIKIIILLSFISYFYLLNFEDIKESLLQTFFFSLGLYIPSIYWIYYVVNIYGNANIFISTTSVLLMLVYFSCYFLFPISFCQIVRSKLNISSNSSYVLLIIFIVVFEIIRSHLFTGYAWQNIGQSSLGTPLSTFLPILGVHGLSFIILLISLSLFFILRRKFIIFYMPVFLLITISYLFLNKINYTVPTDKYYDIAVIQGNIKQVDRWTKKSINNAMRIYKELTYESLNAKPDMVFWPEAAIPIQFNLLEKTYYKEIIGNLSNYPNTSLVIGTFIKDSGGIYNSILNLNNPKQHYYKKHLVPFGEYMPFRNILSFLYKNLTVPMTDIQTGHRDNALLISNELVYSSICYESIFPYEHLIKNKDIGFILNITNDSWFGDSLAPYQHLDALRLRSAENQRFSVRSATTGISAVINHYGDIINQLDFQKKGILYSKINIRKGITPYAKFGNYILYILIIVFLIYCLVFEKLRVRRSDR
ncbi:MAG: apolipoprotein N-acyltransferase [Gammaproteobacteria bacterium]|nr:apolipoprotein N-acyltransferase [Gammaproteobacteria bacterium]|tara:strand:+ start:4834 stop:6321 length:1488 start_codon:yes stop_codon:yes gene_type:complete